jgi:hypothetical protein
VDASSARVKMASSRHATFLNRTRDTSAKSFEQRFSGTAIEGQTPFAATTPYIELNPCRGDLVWNPVDWAWSTYRLHAASRSRSSRSRGRRAGGGSRSRATRSCAARHRDLVTRHAEEAKYRGAARAAGERASSYTTRCEIARGADGAA